jgi:hypothetical protein
MANPKKKKIKKVPASSTGKKRVRRVRRVRKSSVIAPAHQPGAKKKKRVHSDALEVDTSFYDEHPPQPEKPEVYSEQENEKPQKKKKKRRGCRDFLFGSCSVLLLLNLVLLGVIIFYANKAVAELKTKDTEAIINFLDEKLEDENSVLYQSLLEGIVGPEVDSGIEDGFSNINVNQVNDFPIFPPDEDNDNLNTGF